MQITSNTTSMKSGVTVSVDKDGYDWCVVVVKGTFIIQDDGQAIISEDQEPLVFTDIHNGEPGNSSIRYECDFVPFKPHADIIVNGHAYSNSGKPVERVDVSLNVGNHIKKNLRVIGDRQWELGISGLKASLPKPFIKMPLLFERAFGGDDHSHSKSKYQGTELRNPIGVGFHKNPDPKAINGKRIPNIMHPKRLYRRWSDKLVPEGFGVVGRNWQPRISFAGTYSEEWINKRYPFLPEDFDEQYYQSAPMDQQIPHLKGREIVQCRNMDTSGLMSFAIPEKRFSILYRFHDRDLMLQPVIDTMVVEPDRHRILLLWRARVQVGRKLNLLREILVGCRPVGHSARTAKPQSISCSEFIIQK